MHAYILIIFSIIIMGSYTTLEQSEYAQYFPEQLTNHLRGEALVDLAVNYRLPEISDERTKPIPKKNYPASPNNVRIPARLNSPLIPYPAELKLLSQNNYTGDPNLIHGHHKSQIDTLCKVYSSCIEANIFPEAPLQFDMDSLKRFARQSYSHRENLINLSTLAFAQRATTHDLSISAGKPIPFSVGITTISNYTSFIIMIQRLRIHIAKTSNHPVFNVKNIQLSAEDATYQMFSNGVYIYHSARPGNKFCIISCGGHFRIYHEALNYWFCGPSSYLDYIFTLSDILNNLDILLNCEEYNWAREMFKLLIDFAEHEGHHNLQVDFIKSMEGFLLNMSDYDEDHAMNWKPILEAVAELHSLDEQICDIKYDIGLPICLLRGQRYKYPSSSYLCRFIAAGKKLNRTHLQEISALHKLIFYAEVDAEAGVKKFLKRVHTKRTIDENAVKNLTRLAKAQFFIAYRKKHKTMPNTLGPVEQIKLLEMYSQKADFETLEALPLSWWDTIKIFNCMDNTMTDDPLEFAKDKGALKSNISFGPGDSRKELLQVIETENYELKDFFATKTIRPRKRMVRRTNQKEHPIKVPDPARLIEKEREQKIEARLFANGELSNKHALSLVAARMKKALSYFDEQLMTPTDRKRKALIHEASRELSQHDNYSLLLDIVGHNQSMQYENTHELAEFLGNLFGYDGWGDLSHYFSHLTVYHYDEYLDKVIESHGQYGGIEGWLNPFWTLHTTLMMKLLRIMTDVVVKTIMVYSDDVNAIIEIKQASEPMVQSVFSKIMKHCDKFGMTVKYSQTMLSKHRITMLRQHYADGIRADSTLKRLLAVSAGNNSVLVSDELEVAGICSSASSAMELSNHHEACCYLKNYKLGLLLCRMPQMILSHINPSSMISPEELPANLSNLLYYSKDDASTLDLLSSPGLYAAAKNDIAAYLQRRPANLGDPLLRESLKGVYGKSVAESRLVDSPDRVLYLQVYDNFLQDLLFYWTYMPSSMGGLGASLHINLMLSGHSVGISKSLHYIFMWMRNFSVNRDYFFRCLTNALGVYMDDPKNTEESRVVTSTWPSEQRICPATTSVQQSIKSMVRRYTRNKKVIQMFELSDDRSKLATELVNIFRTNFHSRIVQFYHENTSIHFVDLLISKVETSSGLLAKVKNITRLRNSLAHRAIENIRMGADTSRTVFSEITENSDVIETLLLRKVAMFPRIKFIEVEEVLYDDKITEVDAASSLLTVRRCAPTHYRNGIKVYDDPKVGNETLYKGELLDNDRMLGNKEELLAAKLVAVTKWFLMKYNLLSIGKDRLFRFDVVKACNMSLSTLTNQTFSDLFAYAPTETGGEILHRIPNIRFSTSTYIRSEMNRSLHYTTELNQRIITANDLVDSNVNFDYLRMRYLVAAIVTDKYDSLRRLVIRYAFSRYTGIKDVQFVMPQPTEYTITTKFKCYSDLRGHSLSVMRFRYLSHSYLHEENVNEWALMPNITEQASAEQIGRNYVDDIILRYSRDLDKDYMLISPQMIEVGVWSPLIAKLYRIDKTWKLDPARDDTEEIAFRLGEVMKQRSKITVPDKSSQVQLSMQTQCLEVIAETAPNDVEFQALVLRYTRLAQQRRHSSKLAIRLSQYHALLTTYEHHRFNLAQSLIHEYLATFHFKVRSVNAILEIDVEESAREFIQSGLGKLSLLIISPDLQTRMMILGFDYIENTITHRFTEILENYRELCSDISCADIIAPTALPSISSWTDLSGDEELPHEVSEIEYIRESIPLSAMSTIEEAQPLFRFAQLCSTTGASPHVFTSHTGSDSLGAQVALFRLLVKDAIIDPSDAICDLTAGRGDGQYAMHALGLSGTSFAREDTFTRVKHHPDVTFLKEYDIFNGATLKFITDFDFIHVDVSFTGPSDKNLLDLILVLEENNLPYSIRVNSSIIKGYNPETTANVPLYNHSLAYAVSSTMKPYQIYLIGTPSTGRKNWIGPSMRQTLAFKSMALSFAQLLSPSNYTHRLMDYRPNSASLSLPSSHMTTTFIKALCDNSIRVEQLYYLQRYMAEVGEDAYLEFSFDHLSPQGKSLIEQRTHRFEVSIATSYTTLDTGQIGNVNQKIRPYHEAHVEALSKRITPVWRRPLIQCDEAVLTHFRTFHPLQEIRTWCNIVLGLLQFCRSQILSGHAALQDLYTSLQTGHEPKPSMHQREIMLSLKLLVLAARDDDYTYGVKYCHKMLTARSRSRASIARTLRIYRLISYLFFDIQRLMMQGDICIRSILSIANEIEVREKKRYKYVTPTQMAGQITAPDLPLQKMIEDSLDNLFSGLEKFATHITEGPQDINETALVDDTTGRLDLRFDLNIQEQVESAIQRLNLVPSGPRGIIDLGDDDIVEFDDW